MKELYRFKEIRYSHYIDSASGIGSYCTTMKLLVERYKVIKETPKGCWIDIGFNKKWVSKESKKRFAYPTVEEARVGYLARKHRQKRILSARLNEVSEFEKMADSNKYEIDKYCIGDCLK